MANLQRRLMDASAAKFESPDERMRRDLDVLYVQTADNPGQVSTSKEKTARWHKQALEDLTDMRASPQQLDY